MNTFQELQNYISEYGISQGMVARGIGKSPAVVNQYLQGKYNGDVVAIDQLVSVWLQKEQEKDKNQFISLSYAYTSSARRVRDVLRLAHLEGEIVVLYGQAGLGKTSALQAYCKDNPDALLVETDPTYTAKVLLAGLSRMLGAESRGSIHELCERIINKLKASGRIILVDEAENLPLRALECLRRIHDKSGIGLVLAGMPRLLVNLRGKNGELKQLYSRVAFRLDLGDVVSDEDLRQMVTCSMGEMADDVVAELVSAAAGNARRLGKLVRGVSRLAQLNQTEMTAAMVQQFKSMLIN